MDTQESVTAKDNSLELQKVEKIQGFIKNYKEGNRLFLYVGIFAIAIYTTIFILSITLADIHGFWSTGILLVTIISIPPTLIGIKKIIKAIIGISIQEGFTRGCGVLIRKGGLIQIPGLLVLFIIMFVTGTILFIGILLTRNPGALGHGRPFRINRIRRKLSQAVLTNEKNSWNDL